MRRLFAIFLIATFTAGGSLYWLHDGDIEAAVEPIKAEWNADVLAADAGVPKGSSASATPAPTPTPTD